jgi:hypothetical protein
MVAIMAAEATQGIHVTLVVGEVPPADLHGRIII